MHKHDTQVIPSSVLTDADRRRHITVKTRHGRPWDRDATGHDSQRHDDSVVFTIYTSHSRCRHRLRQPDHGRANSSRICTSGYALIVACLLRSSHLTGVAALHLEDQVQSKRCGHLMGKQIVPREEFYSRIRAAKAARDACGSEMLIIARTDARAGELVGAGAESVNGHSIEESAEMKYQEAVERLKGAREAGADVLFFEAATSKDEARRACQDLAPTPMLLNMVPEGVTPNMSVVEAQECGFRIMIFPTACIEGVLRGCGDELTRLRKEGAMKGDNKGIRVAFDLCGLQEAVDVDKAAGGEAYGQV